MDRYKENGGMISAHLEHKILLFSLDELAATLRLEGHRKLTLLAFRSFRHRLWLFRHIVQLFEYGEGVR